MIFNDAYKIKIVNIFILIFALFPIIPNNLKGFPVILLAIVSACFFKKGEVNWKMFLINSSLFLMYLFTLIYTENLKFAFKKLETGLSILVIPLIFYIFLTQFEIKNKIKIQFYKWFIFSSFIFSIITFVYFFIDNSTTYYNSWYTDKFRTIIVEIPLIGQHPIYASIFLSLSVLFFIELSKLNSFKFRFRNRYFIYILIIISLLMMLLSKGVIIAILIISLIFVFNNLKKGKLIVFITFVSAFVLLLSFNRRMKELINFETYSEINENFSTSIRIGIYKCSCKVFSEEWVWGYGIGNAQEALNLCYANKSNILLKNRFNSHNQYLDVAIKTGALGFFLFLYFLFANFKKAKENKNRLATFVISFYCIIFLIENILVRQSGVILFFFLISFLNHKETSWLINEDSKSKPVQNS